MSKFTEVITVFSRSYALHKLTRMCIVRFGEFYSIPQSSKPDSYEAEIYLTALSVSNNNKQNNYGFNYPNTDISQAVAAKQMSNLEIAARAIVVLIVIYYATLLDFLSGTLDPS